MANPPPNVGQSYFWGTGVSQPQNMGYYSVPPPNFPPPNFSQPPPSYNIPVSTLPENKGANFIPPYHAMGTCYQNEVSNSYDVPYQTPTELQCNNQNYGMSNYSQPVNNFNTIWDDGSAYHNSDNAEWKSNNYSFDWNKPQNSKYSWYETNNVQEDDRKSSYVKFNDYPKNKSFEWRYRDKEPSNSYSTIKRRSRSPQNRSRESRSSRSPNRSRHDSQREKYSKYPKNRSVSRERLYCEEDSDRRSIHRKNNLHTSRSQGSYISYRSRKRSRSQDSYSSRTDSPNNNPPINRDRTERELLLEKYRYLSNIVHL